MEKLVLLFAEITLYPPHPQPFSGEKGGRFVIMPGLFFLSVDYSTGVAFLFFPLS
jgi:hypothetical protein